MRIKIRSKLGVVLEVELCTYRKKITLIKVKILHDITKPLKLGIHFVIIKDGTSWVDFRYEKKFHVLF